MTTNIVQARQMNVTSTVVTANSYASNGYVTFATGLTIQWGRFVLPASGDTTVSFPITFPTAVFSCVPSQGDSSGYGYPFATDNLSTSGFLARNSAGGINAGTGYYIAIGW